MCLLNQTLNDVQYISPSLLNNATSILLGFREHIYAITADIEKIYRNINVDVEHLKDQRIFWREHLNDEIQCYELKTVTYGTASVPFFAIRCLHEVADIVRNSIYMDDILTGADSISRGCDIKNKFSNIIKYSGF